MNLTDDRFTAPAVYSPPEPSGEVEVRLHSPVALVGETIRPPRACPRCGGAHAFWRTLPDGSMIGSACAE